MVCRWRKGGTSASWTVGVDVATTGWDTTLHELNEWKNMIMENASDNGCGFRGRLVGRLERGIKEALMRWSFGRLRIH